MSRFLLLILFLIWLAWRATGDTPMLPKSSDLTLFFGLYLLLLGMLAVWARLLALRIRRGKVDRAFRYFNRVVFIGRMIVPVWFAVGVFGLHWGDTVQWLLGPVAKWPVQLPGAILGTIPPLLAWAGLSWAQYPAEYALREQTMLLRFDDGEPIFRPPSLWSYIVANFRLQVLFTAIPILLILLLHDTTLMVLLKGFGRNVSGSGTEALVTFCSAVVVFLIVPQILIRVLPTEPFPDSPLRQRMEAMCRASRIRFRDIRLWRTQHRIANALVMGIIPRFRYVLLSDLLLDEMNDEQIEAVFAHELGHAVHRHLIWYLVFFKALIITGLLCDWSVSHVTISPPAWLPMDLLTSMIGFAAFLIAFGWLSRRFERQADVFAARTLQSLDVTAPAPLQDRGPVSPPTQMELVPAGPTHVGPLGARLFASALERVAAINNMSIGSTRRFEGSLARRISFILEFMGDAATNWLHGSIAHRMQTLQTMSEDPAQTHRFDRRMTRLYGALVVVLVLCDLLAWHVKVWI